MGWEAEHPGCVVVGVEESGPITDLVMTGANEAVRRNRPLAVISVAHPAGNGPSPLLADDRRTRRAPGPGRLDEALALVARTRPALKVTDFTLADTEVRSDHEPLASADLLVLGAHGSSGLQAFGPGTVSWRLLRAAQCPVLVIPDQGPGRTAGPDRIRRPLVLAGLSGEQSDPVVTAVAFAEAHRRHCDVQFLHSYSPQPAAQHPGGDLEQAVAVITAALARTSPVPGVRCSVVLSEEPPAAALCRQAIGAGVLVVAARSGSMAGLIDGAVSRAVLAVAPCPVLVVPWLLLHQQPDGRSPAHQTPSASF
jgi:nucleotide-binding universal stress UspA family protein